MEGQQVHKGARVKKAILKWSSYFIRWFVVITTGILIICAVNFTVFGEGDIPASILWDILVSGLATTAVTVIFWSREEAKKGGIGHLVMFFHYICLCVVMVIFGTKFGWMELNVPGILMMVLSVAGVYFFSYTVNYILNVQKANAMNQKLKEKYGE